MVRILGAFNLSTSGLLETYALGFSDDSMMVKTALGSFSRPWFNFVVWTCLGCLVGLSAYNHPLLNQV